MAGSVWDEVLDCEHVATPSGDDGKYHWAVLEHYWDRNYCCYPERGGDMRSVTKPSDFYSSRKWRSSTMYCDYLRPLSVEHMLTMSLPEAPGTALREFGNCR